MLDWVRVTRFNERMSVPANELALIDCQVKCLFLFSGSVVQSLDAVGAMRCRKCELMRL